MTMKDTIHSIRREAQSRGVTAANVAVVVLVVLAVASGVVMPPGVDSDHDGTVAAQSTGIGDNIVFGRQAGNDITIMDPNGTVVETWGVGDSVFDVELSESEKIYSATIAGIEKFNADGSLAWNYTIFNNEPRRVAVSSDGNAVAGDSFSGQVGYVDSAGNEVWQVSGPASSYHAAEIVDGRIFIGDKSGGVYELDPADGSTLNSGTPAANQTNQITAGRSGNYLYAIDDAGELYKLDIDTLNVVNSVSVGSGELHGLSIVNDRIYIADDASGDGFQFDSNLTQTQRYEYNGGSDPIRGVTASGGEVYIGDIGPSDTVVFDASDGTELRNLSTGETSNMVSMEEVPVSVSVSGTVTDSDGNAVEGATVSADDPDVESVTTNASGQYELTLPEAGTYTITATLNGESVSRTVDVPEGGLTGVDFQFAGLTIETSSLLRHGESQPYEVRVEENGTARTVTDEANVTSLNTSAVTVNEVDNTLVAVANESFAGRVTIRATYNGSVASTEVTVAEVSVENLKVLPPVYRISAFLGDWTVFLLIIASGAGIVGTRAASAFMGLSMAEFVLVIGWFGGYISTGLAMTSVFAALFIGLNLAANIDYTVRR